MRAGVPPRITSGVRPVWGGMGEDWLTQALTNRWTVAAIAYLAGVVTGWLIWRVVSSGGNDGRADHRGDLKVNGADDAKSGGDGGRKDNAPASRKLSALETEIREAKAILEADAEEHAALAEILTGLDEAVKRANGRLKLILKSVKSGRDRG